MQQTCHALWASPCRVRRCLWRGEWAIRDCNRLATRWHGFRADLSSAPRDLERHGLLTALHSKKAGRSGLLGQPAFSILSQFFDGTSPFTPTFAGVDGVRALALPSVIFSTFSRVISGAVHLTTMVAQVKLRARLNAQADRRPLRHRLLSLQAVPLLSRQHAQTSAILWHLQSSCVHAQE